MKKKKGDKPFCFIWLCLANLFYGNVAFHYSVAFFVMWIAISALNLAFAVMLGAFGAHGLKAHASPEQLAWWQTATDYFFIMRLDC